VILYCLYTVNKITSRESKASNISYVITPEDIILFFQRINTYTQYSALELLPIQEGTHVPSLDVLTVRRFLTRLRHTAPGPDGFPYWLWRDFAHHLAPVVIKLFNSSLRQQSVPLPWKLANISPIPKVAYEVASTISPVVSRGHLANHRNIYKINCIR